MVSKKLMLNGGKSILLCEKEEIFYYVVKIGGAKELIKSINIDEIGEIKIVRKKYLIINLMLMFIQGSSFTSEDDDYMLNFFSKDKKEILSIGIFDLTKDLNKKITSFADNVLNK